MVNEGIDDHGKWYAGIAMKTFAKPKSAKPAWLLLPCLDWRDVCVLLDGCLIRFSDFLSCSFQNSSF